MGLQKALKVEAALEKAISEGRVGEHSLFNEDGTGCCTVGVAIEALGSGDCGFNDMNSDDVADALGCPRESRDQFGLLLADVMWFNDGLAHGSGDKRKAAAILVGAIKEFCDDD